MDRTTDVGRGLHPVVDAGAAAVCVDDVSRWAAELAHDLRVPLAAVAGYAERLIRTAGTRLTEEEQAMMATLLHNIARMDVLIDRTLLTGTDLGVDAATPVSVDGLVADVLGDLAEPLAQADAEIHVGGLGTVRGDAVELRRVFQNIVGNAVRYRHPHRRLVLRIEAHDEGEERHFTIADNGLGFARSRAQHAARFGIGLRICHRIVSQHGGRVWIDSCGRGAIVGLALPRSGA